MMRSFALAVLGLVIAACSAGESDSTSTVEEATVSQVPTTASTTTLIEGRLPDGRGYLLESDVAVGGPEGVFAVIQVVMENAPITGEDIGCPTCSRPVLGITTFHPRSGQPPEFENGVYKASSGSWAMHIAIYDFILDAWGEGLEADLLQHIRPVDNETGLPAFHLSGPFEWAQDLEVPARMEVFYSDFVVRRGCDQSSVACSSSDSVQVVPLDEVVAPAPTWDESRKILISEGP